MRTRRTFLALCGAVALAGCGGNTTTPTDTDETPAGGVKTFAGDMAITSPAFDDGESIPTEYTGEGADVSPPLEFSNVPDGAASLALVVDDPDAPGGTFVHWLLWNVPPETTRLPQGLPQTKRLETLGGARQGTNGFGELGYRGPLPPKDHGPHTYRFTLSALDATLDVPAGAKRPKLETAMSGHVLERARLTGTYER